MGRRRRTRARARASTALTAPTVVAPAATIIRASPPPGRTILEQLDALEARVRVLERMMPKPEASELAPSDPREIPALEESSDVTQAPIRRAPGVPVELDPGDEPS